MAGKIDKMNLGDFQLIRWMSDSAPELFTELYRDPDDHLISQAIEAAQWLEEDSLRAFNAIVKTVQACHVDMWFSPTRGTVEFSPMLISSRRWVVQASARGDVIELCPISYDGHRPPPYVPVKFYTSDLNGICEYVRQAMVTT